MRASALLVPVLAIGAILGTVWMFGSNGPATDDEALLGTWTSTTEARALDLHEDGTYAMTVGTNLECGRWRAMGGNLQMRVEKSASSIALAMMKEPRMRAGSYAHRGDRLGLDLQEASGARVAWLFSRGAGERIDCTSQ